MAYIDVKYLGKCETCRHHRLDSCNTYCDCGEKYSPDLSKIPTADVVEVKHGEYIHKGAWHIECLLCGHILAHIDEAKNYCPNCGALIGGSVIHNG